MSTQQTIAIVGRPNVGKSALFNRLVGKRLAIVHEESGVTRDRLVAEAQVAGRRFNLMDTGGIGVMDGTAVQDHIESGILKQVEVGVEDADLILFVTDTTAGIAPLDREVARQLHACGRPVFLLANKSDNEEQLALCDEFEALGFPVFPVSALHNRGIQSCMEQVLKEMPAAVDEEETEPPLKVAIVGRPNAGKSSYINRLLRSERVIVSEVAGTTRDSIEIPFAVGTGPSARRYTLIDTAGIRKKSSARSAVEKFSLIRAQKAIADCDLAILLFDAMEGPKMQDKKIAANIIKHAKGCLVLINKWDLSEVTERQYGKAVLDTMPFLNFAPIVFISAETGYNVRRSVEAIDFVAAQISTRLTTGALNRTIQQMHQKVQPPMVRGKRLKIYYGTQVGTRPVALKLFVNDPKLKVAAYESYLINGLRRAFGLEGAPLRLIFAPRRKEDREK